MKGRRHRSGHGAQRAKTARRSSSRPGRSSLSSRQAWVAGWRCRRWRWSGSMRPMVHRTRRRLSLVCAHLCGAAGVDICRGGFCDLGLPDHQGAPGTYSRGDRTQRSPPLSGHRRRRALAPLRSLLTATSAFMGSWMKTRLYWSQRGPMNNKRALFDSANEGVSHDNAGQDEYRHPSPRPDSKHLWGDTLWVSHSRSGCKYFCINHFHLTNRVLPASRRSTSSMGCCSSRQQVSPVAGSGQGAWSDGRLTYEVLKPAGGDPHHHGWTAIRVRPERTRAGSRCSTTLTTFITPLRNSWVGTTSRVALYGEFEIRGGPQQRRRSQDRLLLAPRSFLVLPVCRRACVGMGDGLQEGTFLAVVSK